jgi:putative endonuclease
VLKLRVLPKPSKPKRSTSESGILAENFAVKLLSSKGYKIIDRNFHSRVGVIDIIAEKDDYLVFVEVKARWSRKFGLPEEAVTSQKIWKIKKTIEYYCLLHPNSMKKMRIDVVALQIESGTVVSSKIIIVD